jgi:hypothetical protein
MVAANIPWYKLENPIFKSFLGKYTNFTIPTESTLRKNYLLPSYISVTIFIYLNLFTLQNEF